MFNGRFHHTLDAKGRVSVPTLFRKVLETSYEEKLTVTADVDGCVVCYPPDEWRRIEEKVRSMPTIPGDVKDFLRFFFSSAVDCPLDKPGRILLPAHLRQYAKLNRDVVMIGVMNKIEIWDERQWNAKQDHVINNKEQISSALGQLGL